MRQIPKPGELYRHFKNKLYQVIAVAKHTETGEDMVVYQALYGDFAVYVRPLAMFLGEVDHEKCPDSREQYRFEKVERGRTAEDTVGNMEPEEKAEPESKTAEAAKPQQNGEPKDSTPQEPEETNGVDPRLLAILDADTYNEKYKLLSSMQEDMTDRLINDLAVALDIAVDDGPVDQRYEKLKSALAMLCKYEVNRLR